MSGAAQRDTLDEAQRGQLSDYRGPLPPADRLVQLVEHRTVVWEVAGSNFDGTNTQGLK